MQHQFGLHEVVEGSERTLSQHLQMIAATSDAAADQLAGPPCPVAAQHIWSWWIELHSRRTGSGFGINPIPFGEMEAWARVMRHDVDAIEWRLLHRIETEYLKHHAKQGKKDDDAPPDDDALDAEE